MQHGIAWKIATLIFWRQRNVRKVWRSEILIFTRQVQNYRRTVFFVFFFRARFAYLIITAIISMRMSRKKMPLPPSPSPLLLLHDQISLKSDKVNGQTHSHNTTPCKNKLRMVKKINKINHNKRKWMIINVAHSHSVLFRTLHICEVSYICTYFINC